MSRKRRYGPGTRLAFALAVRSKRRPAAGLGARSFLAAQNTPVADIRLLASRQFVLLPRHDGDGRARKQRVGLGVAGGTGERPPPAGERSERALFRGDRLRLEIDAQRLRDAGAIRGIGLVAVPDLPLDDLDRYAVHRRLVVVEQLVLLLRRHQPEEIAGLPVIIVAVAVIVAVGIARDFQRRLAEALVLHGAVERVRLLISVRYLVGLP